MVYSGVGRDRQGRRDDGLRMFFGRHPVYKLQEKGSPELLIMESDATFS